MTLCLCSLLPIKLQNMARYQVYQLQLQVYNRVSRLHTGLHVA